MSDDMQEQQMQQMALPPMSVSPASFQKDTETVKFRLENEELLTQLEHDLKGEYWIVEQMVDNNGQPVFDDKGVPVMIQRFRKVGIAKCNDYGAKTIISFLRMLINKNSLLSDLNEDLIQTICRNTCHPILNLLEDKSEEFGIDAKELETIIMTCIGEPLEIALRRAEMGRERDAISETHFVNETHLTGGQQKSRLPFMGGN